jgi:sulfate transport system permease protein
VPLQRRHSVLPGFGLTLGFSLFYLCLVVLIPLAALALKAMSYGWDSLWHATTAPRVLASYRLTFGASAAAALVNAVFGFVVAWVLVRYRFPGRRVIDALVDLPFALPTAVAGIALTSLYAETGWLGRPLASLGLKVAFTPLGVGVALTFIGLPRRPTLQPVISPILEEAATSLGASRWAVVRRASCPYPGPQTGFAPRAWRSVIGPVVFISRNMPYHRDHALLLITKLEQFDYPHALRLCCSSLSSRRLAH